MMRYKDQAEKLTILHMSLSLLIGGKYEGDIASIGPSQEKLANNWYHAVYNLSTYVILFLKHHTK